MTQDTQISLYKDGSTIIDATSTDKYFLDDTSPNSIIGAINLSGYSNYFTGFIASFSLSNGNIDTIFSDLCLHSSKNVCSINCDFDFTEENSNCIPCDNSCVDGCVRSTDCRLNGDVKCLSYTDWFTCTTCIDLTEISTTTGNCECVTNASYNSDTNTCSCNTNFQESSGKCVLCKSYFKTSDITSAKFNTEFTKVIIKFNTNSVTSSVMCADLIMTETLTKLGTSPTCTWTASDELTLGLGVGFTLREELVYLNGENILKASGSCSFSFEVLSPSVVYSTSPPTPQASLSGPDSYSITCAVTGLELFGDSSVGKTANLLIYSWSVTSSSAALQTYLGTLTSSNVVIDNTYLQEGTHTFSLTVTNVFGKSDIATQEVNVTSESSLTISIEGGSPITMKASEIRQIKGNVEEFCGGSTAVSLEWSYVGATSGNPTVNMNQILMSSNTLLIQENALSSGFDYQFKFKASEGSDVSGQASLIVKVEATDLVAIIFKADGTISKGVDLKLDASESSDPDNTAETLSFSWSCIEELGGDCLDSDGNLLLSSETSSVLEIPKESLRLSAIYVFTVTISKDTRSSSDSVSLEVEDAGDVSLDLPAPLFKVNKNKDLYISVLVNGQFADTVLWEQKLGLAIFPTTPAIYPFIHFTYNTMDEGEYYAWQITVFTPSLQSISALIPWNTNRGPSCINGITISPSTGIARETKFQINMNECIDLDDEDYPLFYSFGVIQGIRYRFLKTISFKSQLKRKFKAGEYTLFGIVCDMYFTCEYYTKGISVLDARRRLDESDILSEFKDEIKDPDNIPGAISNYIDEESLTIEV